MMLASASGISHFQPPAGRNDTGTFPRYRFDQLMDLGWKWLIPLALANIIVTGLVVLLVRGGGA